jgi:hypothetical protein
MDALSQAAQEGLDPLKYATADDFYKSLLEDVTWSKGGTRQYLDNFLMQQNLLEDTGNMSLEDAYKKRKLSNTYGGYQVKTGEKDETGRDIYETRAGLTPEQIDFMSKNIVMSTDSEKRIQSGLEDLMKQASDYGVDTQSYIDQLKKLKQAGNRQSIYGWSGHQDNSGSDVSTYNVKEFKNIMDSLYKDIGDVQSNTLDRLVEGKYGMKADEFRSGDWIDEAGVSSQQQADQMAALQRLMGKETNELTGGASDPGIGSDLDFMANLKKRLGYS